MRTAIPSAALLGSILFAGVISAAPSSRYVTDERGNLYSARLVNAGVQMMRRSPGGVIGYDVTVDGLGEVRLGAVATDRSGSVWVTGSTRSSGNWDMFVLQLSSEGAVVRNERIGGGGDDFGEGIAVSRDGSVVYLAGTTDSESFVLAMDARDLAAGLSWTRVVDRAGDGSAMLAVGGNGQLYYAGAVGADAAVMRLDPNDGHTLWRTNAGHPDALWASGDEVILAGVANAGVFAVRLTDGGEPVRHSLSAGDSRAFAVTAVLRSAANERLIFVRTQDAGHGIGELAIRLSSDGGFLGRNLGTVEQYWSAGGLPVGAPAKERGAAAADRTASASSFNPANFTSLGTLTAAGVVTFDTDSLTFTGGGSPGVLSNGVAVFTFSGISVPNGATVKGTGSRPLALLSQGNITVDGVIDANGANAVDLSEAAVAGGPGGYCGGQWSSGAQQPGCGPGGGAAAPGAVPGASTGGGGGGYGGAGGVGGNSGGLGGTAYGDLTTTLDGGSGGASGTRSALTPIAASGGGGGGALLVAANGTLTVSAGGVVRANGGSSAISAKAASGAGAGGGIYLKAVSIVNNGTVSANGGTGSDGVCCGGGGGGGGGRVVAEGTLSGSGVVTVAGGAGGTSGGSPGTPGAAGSMGAVTYIQPTFTFPSGGTTVPSTAGAGTVALTVAPATSTWSATSSQSWLTLTSGQSGTGSGTIGYSYTLNNSINSRSAVISAGGSSYTITQQGAAVSVSFDSASQTVLNNASSGSAALTVTPSDGGWSVASNQGWLTLTSSTTGTGSTLVQFSLATNSSYNSRQAVITATGGSSQSTHTVTQSGVPVTAVFSPLSATKTAAAGSDSFDVTISPHCAPWGNVTSDQSWLVVGSYDGSGNGSVSYSYTANNSVNARVGHITVGTSLFTVTQAGVPPAITLVPSQLNLPGTAGSATFVVNLAPSDATYAITTATPWISITSAGSQTAGGTVTFSYPANGSVAPRQGSIVVTSPGALGAATFMINQGALPAAFVVDPQVTTVNANATPLILDVTASPAEVTWTASSNVPWITVPDSSVRVGNGKLSIQVAANLTGVIRSGTLTVAGLTVTINQRTPETCAVELARDGWSAAFVGDVADIGIGASSGCSWSVSGNPAWITFAGSTAGSGAGRVKLRIAPNPLPTARSAVLSVGDKTFTVHQLANGCELSVNTRQGALAPTGDSLAIKVVTGANCEWRPFIGPSWLTPAYSSMHRGNEMLTLSAGPNLTNATRTAGLIAGSQVVQVVQGSDNTPQQFGDVPRTHPFFPYIAGLGRNQPNAGCGGGNFCPDANSSRAAVAAFIVRAIVGESFSFESQPYFTDVPSGHPQFRYIQKIRELGITSGCTASTYCPDDPITRGQMAALLLRARFGINPSESIPVSAAGYFSDVAPGSLFYQPVQKMKDLSVTTGCRADAYCPDAPATRGQTAAFLMRVFYTP